MVGAGAVSCLGAQVTILSTHWSIILNTVFSLVNPRHHAGLEYVDKWHRRGVTVMVWTVNSPVEKRFYRQVMKTPVLTDTLDMGPLTPTPVI